MKLFRVEVHKVGYVLAEDERDAEEKGGLHVGEEDADFVSASEVGSLEDVEKAWKEAIPYGGEGDQTIRQWFERPEEPKPFVDPPEQQWFDFGRPNASVNPS